MGLPSPTDGREASPYSGENGRYGPWRRQYPHRGDAWTSPLNHHGDWGTKALSHRRQLWISLIAFVVIYGTIATVDLLLMLRYSRKELPPPAPRLLLAYQAWTYYVFRRRVSRSDFQPATEPSPTQNASLRRN